MKTKLLLLLLSITILSSCSKYGYVRLKYPNSPNAVLPDGIKTIAIVNRSIAPKDNKHNILTETILSGEVAGSDKVASDECLKAIFDRFNGYQDYRVVFPAKTRLVGTGTRVTPDILDWKVVKDICDSTNADVLLVLEMFDSNSDILLSALNNQLNSVLAGNTGTPAPPNQIRMNVISYWRMYDPKNKAIIDQYQSTSYLTFNTTSLLNTPPPEALPQTAYAAGEEYIYRFLPSYYYVKRDLYKKGKGAFKEQFRTGFRKSEVANWKGAYDVWLSIAEKATGKNAGKACLNLAVACEVLGKNEEALAWAKKSYEDYGNKLGRDYANILKYRINVE